MQRCALWLLTRTHATDCLLPLTCLVHCPRKQGQAATSVCSFSGSSVVRHAHENSPDKRLVLVHPRCLDQSYLDEAQNLIHTAYGIKYVVIWNLSLHTLACI
jgi:hypothetical protein